MRDTYTETGLLKHCKMKFTFLAVLSFQVVSLARGQFGGFGFAACDKILSTCLNTSFIDIEAAGDNNEAICTSVDGALACVAKELDNNCNPLSKANIIRVTHDITGIYQGEPNNCVLSNANDSAFHDPCANALTYCNNIYYQAEYTTPMSEACGLFDTFTECMKKNTSHCGMDAISIISMSIRNVTAKMNNDPFFCSERDNYDIAGCETGFYDCVNPLSTLYMAALENGATAEVCSEVAQFMQCVLTNNPKCSPRLQEQNMENANNITNVFSGDPFNCPTVNLVTPTTLTPTLPTTKSTTTTTTTLSTTQSTTSTTTAKTTTTTTTTTILPLLAAPTIATTTTTASTITTTLNVQPVERIETKTVNPDLKKIPSGDIPADDIRKDGPAGTNRNQNGLDTSHENQKLDGATSNRNQNEKSGRLLDGNTASKFAYLSDATPTRTSILSWSMTMLLSLLLI